MRETKTSCPSAEDIERLLLSDASEEELDALALHLDTCSTCRRHAEQITPQAILESDLHWATEVRAQTNISVEDPLHRLSEILPDYELIREVGRGGMGIVYMAHQPKLDRMVAIKVLPALVGVVRPEFKARFRREAELAAGLDHTNIISVYDFGEADGTLFYTMQLIKGRSLRGILREIEDTGAVDCVVGEQRPGSTRTSSKPKSSSNTPDVGQAYFLKIAHWIAEVADALQYAHDHGVIHRDIKPSNLLLTEDGRLMISDFGLARPTDAASMTAANSLMGTCRYMAPEQFDQDRKSPFRDQHLVDVYALGATLYELLAFRPVYAAPDDRQVIHQIQHVEVVPPRRFVSQVPVGLETICLKAISKQQKDRYASAEAFADDLRRWTLDLPIHARRQTLSERTTRFVKRRKLTASLIAVCVLLAGISGIMYTRSRSASTTTQAALDSAAMSSAQRLTQSAWGDIHTEAFDKAIDASDQALALRPDLGDARYAKAVALERLGRSEESRAILEESVANDVGDWRSRFLLGMIIHPGHGRAPGVGPRFEDRSNDDDTLRLSATLGGYIAQIKQIHPDSAELLCLQSCVEPDHSKAISLLDQALETDPTLTEALVERASRYGYLGRFREALESIDRAIKLGHGGHQIYGQRGIALYQLGDHQGAIRAMSEAIKRDPNNVDWLYNRAVSYTYLGQHNLAIRDASSAIELEPGYASAYMIRARAYTALSSIEEALADFSIAAELDPHKGDIYVERGFLYWLMGNYTLAMEDANTLIALEPDQLRGYQRRAQVYLRLEQWDNALADLDYCLTLQPDEETTYRLRGGVLFLAGRYEQAIDAFAESIKRLPTFYGSYEYRAMCFLRLGRYQEAIADLTAWISAANERIAMGRMRRGMVYELMGEHQLALTDYAAARGDPQAGLYPDLWSAILLMLDGEPEGEQLLSQVRAQADDAPWLQKIVEILDGQLDPDAFRSIAQTAAQSAEAEYYIGIHMLLDRDQAGAGKAFNLAASMDPNAALQIYETDFAAARARLLR